MALGGVKLIARPFSKVQKCAKPYDFLLYQSLQYYCTALIPRYHFLKSNKLMVSWVLKDNKSLFRVPVNIDTYISEGSVSHINGVWPISKHHSLLVVQFYKVRTGNGLRVHRKLPYKYPTAWSHFDHFSSSPQFVGCVCFIFDGIFSS